MQGFKALPAKMHSMFSFQANCSTQSARALRWIVAIWIALALMGNVLAQSATTKADLQEEAQGAGVAAVVHRHHQLAARPERDLAGRHRRFDLRQLAFPRVAQPHDAGLVLVAQGQVQRQINVTHQAELDQRLLRR